MIGFHAGYFLGLIFWTIFSCISIHLPASAFFPQLPGCIYTSVLVLFCIALISCHHPCHFIIIHSNHRGTQNCCHRNVLHRIIDHGQQTQHSFHLRGGKITCPRLGNSRNPFIHKYIYKHLWPAAHTPQQYDHIFIAGFPVSLLIFIPHIHPVFLICKTFDLLCDHFCFQLSACIICCIFVQLFKSFWTCIRH